MINSSTIEEIKNRIDIVDVVSDFVSLKRSGSSFKALSPFTNEKTPSFYVVPSKGIFKDFSSGKGGDAITFVMEVDGLSYVDALKYLAGKYGIEIKEEGQSDESFQAKNKRESLYIVLNYACRYFQEVLHNSDEGKSIGMTYFNERKFTDETIKKFELGYSQNIWDGLLKEAVSKGYERALLTEAGLVVDKEGKYYDRFRGRVLFPIHNVSGKTIAFGGRKLSSTDKSAKYINSPETNLYVKGNILYGIYQAKNAIRKENNCYLVEGYTDVISMHQAGIENVVASSGTALTENQVKLIGRYAKNVTVIFDGDEAGISASMRGIDLLLEGDLDVEAVTLPNGEDPDSYVKVLGVSGFQEFVAEEAKDIILFKTKMLLNNTGDDPVKKAGVIKDIVSSVAKVNDTLKRIAYLKKCSELLNIAESVLVAEQNKILIQNRKTRRHNTLSDADMGISLLPSETSIIEDSLDENKIIEYQERESIRLLLNYGKESISSGELGDDSLVDYLLREVDEIEYSNPVYRKVINLYKEKLRDGEIVDFQYLMNLDDEEVKKTAIDLTTSKFEVSENWPIPVTLESNMLKSATFHHVIRLKHRIIKKLAEDLKNKLEKETDHNKIDELIDQIIGFERQSQVFSEILGTVTIA